jgi:hypothetical protein
MAELFFRSGRENTKAETIIAFSTGAQYWQVAMALYMYRTAFTKRPSPAGAGYRPMRK